MKMLETPSAHSIYMNGNVVVEGERGRARGVKSMKPWALLPPMCIMMRGR
jgi:hypothetical protein